MKVKTIKQCIRELEKLEKSGEKYVIYVYKSIGMIKEYYEINDTEKNIAKTFECCDFSITEQAFADDINDVFEAEYGENADLEE